MSVLDIVWGLSPAMSVLDVSGRLWRCGGLRWTALAVSRERSIDDFFTHFWLLRASTMRLCVRGLERANAVRSTFATNSNITGSSAWDGSQQGAWRRPVLDSWLSSGSYLERREERSQLLGSTGLE